MIIEAIVLVGATAAILFLFAEAGKPIVGILASIMLMVLSLWILGSGIQITTGETHLDTNLGLEVGTANGTNDGSSLVNGSLSTFSQDMKTNVTTATSGTTNSTVAYVHGDLPTTPYMNVPSFFGATLLLTSFYLFFYYIFIVIGTRR